ncbi:hypothetical protein BE17_23655 [Sorangium cellulosum]|uniref:Uncharacterized protein n=1 Tax=Sorangium cellulosum TaxID=56 RepID=A0A150SXS7_SORCE|nr:hypothetical protein BE17_23655 [Sorangium cellulosum]
MGRDGAPAIRIRAGGDSACGVRARTGRSPAFAVRICTGRGSAFAVPFIARHAVRSSRIQGLAPAVRQAQSPR